MSEYVAEVDKSFLALTTSRLDIDEILWVTLELIEKPEEQGSFTVSQNGTSNAREIVLLGNFARLASSDTERRLTVFRGDEIGNSATFASVKFNGKNNLASTKVTFSVLVRGLTRKDHLKLTSSVAPQGFNRISVEKFINNKLELIYDSPNPSGLSHDIVLDWP